MCVRSFVSAWHASMRTHEQMADSRLRFGLRLNEISEELNNLVKEVDKNRKLVSIPLLAVRLPLSASVSPRLVTANRRKSLQLVMSARSKNQNH